MTENNTDLSEIMIYKDFHKERRHLVYYIFIYIYIHKYMFVSICAYMYTTACIHTFIHS